MWARFLNLVSTNPLVSAIAGTFIGTVLATQYVAWKAPDLGSYFGDLGRWLRAPAGATHNDIIMLAVVAILFGFISCVAIFLREYLKSRRREPPVAPPAAPAPAPLQVPPAAPPSSPKEMVLDDLNENQRQLLVMLLRVYPHSIDMRVLLQNFQLTYLAGEILVESVEKLGLVTISPAYNQAKSVSLTKLGRDFSYKVGLDLLG